MWRMAAGDPYGALMWFDPATERPLLVRLEEPPLKSGVGDFMRGDDTKGSHEQIQVNEPQMRLSFEEG